MSKTEAVCAKILVPLALLLVLRLSASAFHRLPRGHNGTHVKAPVKFNYAGYEAGAKVLAVSAHITGAKGLLQETNERYMVVPCHFQEEWIEIGLSEDIRLEALEVFSDDMYCSSFSEIQVEGAATYPASKWSPLGTFPLAPGAQRSLFSLSKRLWLRYLRITFFTSGRSDHYYCAMNRIAAYGSTLLQGLKEELEDTQVRTSQQLHSIKNSLLTTSVSSFSSPSSSISDSLLLISNMQRLRTTSTILTYPPTEPESFGNETVASRPLITSSKSQVYPLKSPRPQSNESITVFKKVADQVASTTVKLEMMGDYMGMLEQLSLRTQNKLAELDHSVRNTQLAQFKGQMEGISEQQSVLAQENSLITDQFQREISHLRASLYALTKELAETRELLLYVSLFAVLNVVFMMLITSCCRPISTGKPRVRLGKILADTEELIHVDSAGNSTCRGDSHYSSFSKAAREQSKHRHKRSRAFHTTAN